MRLLCSLLAATRRPHAPCAGGRQTACVRMDAAAHLLDGGSEPGGAPTELGLLPFPMDDCLLPGETKQLHLFEARLLWLTPLPPMAGHHSHPRLDTSSRRASSACSSAAPAAPAQHQQHPQHLQHLRYLAGAVPLTV